LRKAWDKSIGAAGFLTSSRSKTESLRSAEVDDGELEVDNYVRLVHHREKRGGRSVASLKRRAVMFSTLFETPHNLAHLGSQDEAAFQRHVQEALCDGHGYSVLKGRILEEAHADVKVELLLVPLALRVVTRPCNGTTQLHVSSVGKSGE